MSKALLDEAYQHIVKQQYTAAKEILVQLPESSTAQRWLKNVDDILQAQNENVVFGTADIESIEFEYDDDVKELAVPSRITSRTVWEYREIVTKNWQHHIETVEYALNQGGASQITVQDSYTQFLNENGQTVGNSSKKTCYLNNGCACSLSVPKLSRLTPTVTNKTLTLNCPLFTDEVPRTSILLQACCMAPFWMLRRSLSYLHPFRMRGGVMDLSSIRREFLANFSQLCRLYATLYTNCCVLEFNSHPLFAA
ncbi:MAG UNVERIFIED_CONTAM: hypothetical protein LVT10_03705 [Anaerolineae bacterium]|jgi:hypothetical protein